MSGTGLTISASGSFNIKQNSVGRQSDGTVEALIY